MTEQFSPSSPRRFSSADLVAGIVLGAIGVVFVISSLQYDLGTAAEFGPGRFPLAAAIVLVALGALIIALAFINPSREPTIEDDLLEDDVTDAVVAERHDVVVMGTDTAPPAPPRQFGKLPWRAMVFITAAIVWFATTIDGLGFILGSFGAVVLASYAQRGGTWWRPFAVAAGLTLLSWLIFVIALRLPAPLVGPWLGG